MILAGALSAAMLLALAACGGTPEETAAEETAVEETDELPELETYQSDEGWSVQYDPEYIEVQPSGSAVDFFYTGGPDNGGDRSHVTVSFLEDVQPEEALYDVTSAWGDYGDVTRTEGFFPGTDDKWGFWRTMDAPEDNSAPSSTAIAGEYNGGVLLLINTLWLTGNNADDMAALAATETIVDSLAYEDFQPQTMYDYVPGVYTAEQDGAVRSVTLREDHTGILSMQDDVDILWGSIELMARDGSFTYEYTVEGDSIMINYDGEWMTFTK